MPIISPQLSAGMATLGNTSGTTGMAHDRIVFQGGNNITLSQSNSGNSATIVISGASVAASPVTFSAGTATNALQSVVFSNSNGISFGLNGSTITASAAGGANDGVNIIAAGTQTANTTGTVVFNNANGITFGMANSSVVTASHNAITSQSNQAVSGANGSFTFQTLTLANSNGISFSTGTQGVYASHNAITQQSTQPVAYSAANGSANFSTITFANSNGVSFSTGTQGLYATVKTDYQSSNANYLTSQNNQAVSGANGSFTFQTLTFANSNGVSWSTGTQGLYATVKTDYLTTARASNDAIGLNTAQTNVTWTVNSGGISFNAGGYAGTGTSATNASITLDSNGLAISVAAPGGGAAVNVSAGTTSNNLQTIVFSNSNGVSFGLNGSTVTASVNAAGGGVTMNSTVVGIFNRMVSSSSSSMGQNSLYIFPDILEDAVACSIIKMPVAMTFSSQTVASAQRGFTAQFGVYTRHATNSTVLASHYSTSYTFAGSFNSNTSCAVSAISAINNSTSYATFQSTSTNGIGLSSIVHGMRELIMPLNTTLTAGEYWFAYVNSTSSAGAAGSAGFSHLVAISTQPNRLGVAANATNDGILRNMAMGTYSATTGAIPATINFTQVNGAATNPIIYFFNAQTV